MTNIPTRFGARRRHLQGVIPTQLLTFQQVMWFQTAVRLVCVCFFFIYKEMVILIVKLLNVNVMVAPCINNIKHFIVQLMHTNYKILLVKIIKAAPKCFGSHKTITGNHIQCLAKIKALDVAP